MNKVIFLVLVVFFFGCSTRNDTLRIGIIKPSTDHLPLQFAFHIDELTKADYTVYEFKSGWETNEALIAGKIDLAIMPFTYAWKGVSMNKPVKIVSFFERESDGIIARKDLKTIQDLQGKKLGVLRASTLDIFAKMLLTELNIEMEFVYLRTPMDMSAALTKGEVDALSFYVPSIFQFDEDKFHIITWYGEHYPNHPCCDLVVNDKAIETKAEKLQILLAGLDKSSNLLNENPMLAAEAIVEIFGIPQNQARRTIHRTKFVMGLTDEGKLFEKQTADMMLKLNYLTNPVQMEDVYYQLKKK
jgi:ABC-type nitrate/sulfonate/bicarbonate transport system substrate-binding protein